MSEIPSDIPSDVVALARKYSMNDDVLVAVCRAILAERARCVSVAVQAHDEWAKDAELWKKEGMPNVAKNSSQMASASAIIAGRINNS